MSKRIDYIDNAKGILILLMVTGHIFNEGLVRNFIYTFHMSAFFIISGFFIESSFSKNWANILKSKIYTILIPMIFFECFGVIDDIYHYGLNQSIFGYLYNFLTFSPNNHVSWFLQGLLLGEIILIALHKITDNKYLNLIYSLLFFIVYQFLSNDIKWQRLLSYVLIAIVLMNIGYYLKNYFMQTSYLLVTLSIIITTLCSYFNYVEIAHVQIGNPVLFLLGSISGLYTIIQISRLLNNKLLSYYGKNTLVFMGTQRCYIDLFEFILSVAEGQILLLVIVVFFETITIYIFNRFIPFLIGKKIIHNRNYNNKLPHGI